MSKRIQILFLSFCTTLIVLLTYSIIADFSFHVVSGWHTTILPSHSIFIMTVLALCSFGGAYGIISLLLSRKERE